MFVDRLLESGGGGSGGNAGVEGKRFEYQSKFDAEVCKFNIQTLSSPLLQSMITRHKEQQEQVILVKPSGYMNNSGYAVAKVMNFYKISPDNLYVFHDDIDLVCGKVKIKNNGSDGGHKGIRSIDYSIGSKHYARIRIGIGRPTDGDRMPVSDYVLQKFGQDEILLLHDVFNQILTDGSIHSRIKSL